MGFDIKNERLRIRRHSLNSYSYEIPELDIKSTGWHNAKAALADALYHIKELLSGTPEYENLKAELAANEARYVEIVRRMKQLERAPHPPVTDLLEQKDLCLRAIKLLEYDIDQPGHHVKMVGFYDMGDTDKDGDRDFVVSFTW